MFHRGFALLKLFNLKREKNSIPTWIFQKSEFTWRSLTKYLSSFFFHIFMTYERTWQMWPNFKHVNIVTGITWLSYLCRSRRLCESILILFPWIWKTNKTEKRKAKKWSSKVPFKDKNTTKDNFFITPMRILNTYYNLHT